MTLLVTGASGFIGSFVVEGALHRGIDTWAGVRSTSSRAYLADPRTNFLTLDLEDEEHLVAQLEGLQFDYVVHAAGATKCKKADDFYRVNTEGTKHLVNALLRTGMEVKKLVFLSSLSVFGAIREEEPYLPILPTDAPQPNTHYGRSKLMAEEYIRSVGDRLNYTILRPTGVYGPRERDYFLMVKSLARGVDISVGRTPQMLTFVYVSDLVEAILLALEEKTSGGAYFVSDGESYESSAFGRIVSERLGLHHVVRLSLPISTVKMVCRLADRWGRLTGHMTALNNDKFEILSQRNWLCDISSTVEHLGYRPQVRLHEGLSRAIDWYKKENWL